jgi:hypothetical protein
MKLLILIRRVFIFFNWYCGTATTNKPIMPALGDYYDEEIGGIIIGRGNRSTRRKTWPSAALSATKPTCCPEANPRHRGGKPATNRLSYGTAIYIMNQMFVPQAGIN